MTRRVRIARTGGGLLTVGGLDLSPGAFPRNGPPMDPEWRAEGAVCLSSVGLDYVSPQMQTFSRITCGRRRAMLSEAQGFSSQCGSPRNRRGAIGKSSVSYPLLFLSLSRASGEFLRKPWQGLAAVAGFHVVAGAESVAGLHRTRLRGSGHLPHAVREAVLVLSQQKK